MFDDFDDRYSQTATESEAHAEWHRNTGIPMGTPGCPQDACHGPDEYDEADIENAKAALDQGEASDPRDRDEFGHGLGEIAAGEDDPDDIPF